MLPEIQDNFLASAQQPQGQRGRKRRRQQAQLSQESVMDTAGCRKFCSWYADPHRHFEKYGDIHVGRIARSASTQATAKVLGSNKQSFASISTTDHVLRVWASCDAQLNREKPQWKLPLSKIDPKAGLGEDFRLDTGGEDEMYCSRYSIKRGADFATFFSEGKNLVLCSHAHQTRGGWKDAIDSSHIAAVPSPKRRRKAEKKRKRQ